MIDWLELPVLNMDSSLTNFKMAAKYYLEYLKVILNLETYTIIEVYYTHTKRDTLSVIHTFAT